MTLQSATIVRDVHMRKVLFVACSLLFVSSATFLRAASEPAQVTPQAERNQPVVQVQNMWLQWFEVFLGPVVTALGFYFVNKQLKVSSEQARIAAENYNLAVKASERSTLQDSEQQTWKKAEFLTNQVKEFHSDKTIENVTYMLDWRIRILNLIGKSVLITHVEASAEITTERNVEKDTRGRVILAQALRSDRQVFTPLEAATRDQFDWFFFRLGQFQQMIDAGLFTYDELEVHLKYVLDLVSGGKSYVEPELTAAIGNYVTKYDFEAARTLIGKRAKSRTQATDKISSGDSAKPNLNSWR